MDLNTNLFEVCVKLSENNFPQSRKDDAYYFVRPDMLVRMDQFGALRDIDKIMGFGKGDMFGKLIYYPTLDELIAVTKPTQLILTVDSGWWAYQDTLPTDSDFGVSHRQTGDNLWFAVANLYNYMADQKVKGIVPLEIITPTDENTI